MDKHFIPYCLRTQLSNAKIRPHKDRRRSMQDTVDVNRLCETTFCFPFLLLLMAVTSSRLKIFFLFLALL